MIAADSNRVAELAGQLGYPATASRIAERFERIEAVGDAAVMVAEDPSGRVVGWVHVCSRRLLESEPHAEIGGLVVDSGARGRGVGRALVHAAEQWARQQGLDAIRLRSNVIRSDAHAFYRRLGYEILKTQDCFVKAFSGPAFPGSGS